MASVGTDPRAMCDRTKQWQRGRCILVHLAVVALLANGLLVTGGGGVAPTRGACDLPINPGEWTGSFELDEEFVPKRFPSKVRARATGTLDLTLSCEGVISGSFTLAQVTVETLDRPLPPLPRRTTCTGRSTQELTSGTLRETAGGGLILELSGRVQRGASFECSPPPRGVKLPRPEGVIGIRLTGSQVGPGALSGGPPEWTSPQLIEARRPRYGSFTVNGGQWQLSGGKGPEIMRLTAPYEGQTFIQGIRTVNETFTVEVDWGPAEPGTVRFTFGRARPVVVAANGSTVSTSLDIGTLERTVDLVVVASTRADSSAPAVIRIDIVPPPAWAPAPTWSATPGASSVTYESSIKVPPRPMTALSVSIPSWVPVIGGPVGLVPSQATAIIKVDSAGRLTEGTVEGEGTFSWALWSTPVRYTGFTLTTISPRGVQFQRGGATARLATVSPRMSFSLADLIGLGELPWWLGGRALPRVELSLDLNGELAGALSIVDDRLDVSEARTIISGAFQGGPLAGTGDDSVGVAVTGGLRIDAWLVPRRTPVCRGAIGVVAYIIVRGTRYSAGPLRPFDCG